ncbi:serine/threonine protein phosphatase, partial [Pseudomonas sp. MWU13-2625]
RDYKYIRTQNYLRLRPHDLVTRNHAARAWLMEQHAQTFEGKPIVVHHHAPSPLFVEAKHKGHLNAAYSYAWPHLIEQADFWIFGHTHNAIDVDLGGCRMISNPRGYPDEFTGFDPFFEIEI